jgi:hypothetical protein
MTALHFAADRGCSDIADLLLQSGASVNALDGSGQTPLMYAVSCDNKVRLQLLHRLVHGHCLLPQPFIRGGPLRCAFSLFACLSLSLQVVDTFSLSVPRKWWRFS